MHWHWSCPAHLAQKGSESLFSCWAIMSVLVAIRRLLLCLLQPLDKLLELQREWNVIGWQMTPRRCWKCSTNTVCEWASLLCIKKRKCFQKKQKWRQIERQLGEKQLGCHTQIQIDSIPKGDSSSQAIPPTLSKKTKAWGFSELESKAMAP